MPSWIVLRADQEPRYLGKSHSGQTMHAKRHENRHRNSQHGRRHTHCCDQNEANSSIDGRKMQVFNFDLDSHTPSITQPPLWDTGKHVMF